MVKDDINTQDVELLDVYGSDITIAESAWVSSGRGDSSDPAKVERLIRMLASEGHDTPFEHVITRWRITAPQRIQVQLLRHRMASHNVASARYGHKFDEAIDIKQKAFAEISTPMARIMLIELDKLMNESIAVYNELMQEVKGNPESKRIRELAAFALPQGVMSQQVLTINLRSLKNLLELRCSEHAQKEIRDIANEMLKLIKERPELTITTDAFLKGIK